LAKVNFHWPWATGPLLKSMTGVPYVGNSRNSSCILI